jgi:hypothetical protein
MKAKTRHLPKPLPRSKSRSTQHASLQDSRRTGRIRQVLEARRTEYSSLQSHQTEQTDLTNIAHGHGAENAPGHTEQERPGDKNAASDSYTSKVGIDNKSANVPGEKGNVGTIVGEKPHPDINQGNMK